MSYKDPQRKKEYNKIYFQKHKEETREYAKAYYREHEEDIKKTQKIYQQSITGKEAYKRYKQSPKGKKIQKKINARKEAQERCFGFVPLNESFKGSEGHHIDNQRVIYIPKKIHRSVWHSLTLNINMDKINKLAFNYLELEHSK